tara:strand:+ start:8610 stop:9761 length:1152 start_codon:yes stop_codon:yes gene_type:complete
MLNKINFLTAGESHGKGLLGIIDGIPAGLNIDKDYLDFHLSRRQKGFGRGGRMKIEKDSAEIYTGIRFGYTIGSPIGLIIQNLDWDNWKKIMEISDDGIKQNKITLPRPGHADLAGIMKYGFDDIRNVIERSSARETTMRVALGSICRKLLEQFNIHVASYVTQIHNITDDVVDYKINVNKINNEADKSPIRVLNRNIEDKMIETIKKAQKNGDTVGGRFKILVSGCPYGLGSYSTWDKKINAKLSEAICSINAIKGISFGRDNSSNSFGSELHDEIEYSSKKFTRTNNNAGGIEGGMSNAQNIIINAVMKPLSTLTTPLKSVDIKTKEVKLAHKERTDSCAVPAAAIVAESMTCMVIADTILDKFGGDSIQELSQHFKTAQF